jgi:predicted nucleotidyltransferase
MPARIPVDHARLASLCQQRRVSELSLFGSVLRDDFRPDSDIDVLVTFAPDVQPALDDLLDLQDELAALFGRPVDLLERRALERERNYVLRRHVLEHLEPLYVAPIPHA